MPKFTSHKMKEITFISIGGQGALAGAEILASAMIMEGKVANVNMFTTGERRNAPVINNIKVADAPPLPNCKNYMTTEMIVFKETLFDAKVPAVLWSLQTLRRGVLMVNSSKPPHLIEFPFDFEGMVATVDAERICHEAVGILPPPFGITILGMYLAVTKAVQWESLESAIMERFPGKIGERNVESVRIAMNQTLIEKKRKILGKDKRDIPKPIPLDQVPSVESYNYIPLQKVGKGSYRIWREHLPVCDNKLCVCDECVSVSYCPEGIASLTNQGFWTDYGFCKGCGICAKECIHGAIRMVPMSTPPCQFECPIGQDIPGYIALIAEGRYKEALELIWEKNPLPGICGRICHHPCELACRRMDQDEALAIRALKRFAVEKGNVIGVQKTSMSSDRGDIAIVGSGPAGLTAAYHLIQMGYSPTIFEASSEPGGIMTRVIPEFILPQHVIKSDIDNIQSLGVKIQTGVTIGNDLTLKDLFDQGFKAIFLATGTPRSIPLPIPGVKLKNVQLGMPFLEAAKNNQLLEIPTRVVIIGGGNVAIDCARTAIRLGGKEVHVVCLESREDMPAHNWEIDAASREGVKIHCSLAPQKIIGRYGVVKSVQFMRVEKTWVDDKGRIQWKLIDSSSLHMRTDYVIIAIGQTTNLNFLGGNEDLKLEVKENGTLKVHPQTQETSVKGIFAGGDLTTGSTSVVEAIAAGEKAAIAIDKCLGGSGKITEKIRKASKVEDISFNLDEIEERERIEPRLHVVDNWLNRLKEVECTYSEMDAKAEANRCTRCDIRGEINFWLRPVDFEDSTKD